MAKHVTPLACMGILVLLSISLTGPVHATGSSVVYVGGSGTGNYTTIHEAIAATSPNGIIIAYPGEYHENIVLDKPLELHGSGQNTTIINGSGTGNVITVTADGVVLQDLTVRGSELAFPRAGIMVEANNTRVANVTLTDNYYGAILAWSTSGAVFEADHIVGNHKCGVYFSHSSMNLFRGNTITDNPFNGCGLYESSNGNRILNNTFARNGFCGVNVRDSSRNVITGNRFEGNAIGIHVPPPPFHVTMEKNVFLGNTQSVEEEVNAFVAVGLLFVAVVFLGMLWLWRRL